MCNILCNTMQDTAAHCNTLQHTATRCNTLQDERRTGPGDGFAVCATGAMQLITIHCATYGATHENM